MKKLVTAAVLLGLSATASADYNEVKDRDGFYLMGGYYDINFDHSRLTNSDDAFAYGAGYLFNKNWALQAVYWEDNFYRQPGGPGTAKQKAELQSYNLDLLYNWTSLNGTRTYPFFKLGVGKYNAAPNPWGFNGPEADEYAKIGLGLQHFFTERFFVQAGADWLGTEDQQDDKHYYVNFGYFFGNSNTGSAPAPVAPTQEAKDSDGDGVLDADDRCPGTPAGAAVDAYGCPLDSDGDGVADYMDACPGTPAGVKVDEKGCEVKVVENVVVDMRLNFDTNKYAIKPEMVSEIAKVAEFLRQYPNVNAQIQGHTDSVGSNAYNQGLSERRASSVKNYLVENFGIDASRLSAVGYGEERPIADNSTSEGRALNRRAEAHAESK